jgi:hypothetical protein
VSKLDLTYEALVPLSPEHQLPKRCDSSYRVDKVKEKISERYIGENYIKL